MSGFHAAYSMGGLVGAGIGGLLAPHLSAATHLLLLTPVGLVAVAIAGRVVLAHPLRRLPGPPGIRHERADRQAERHPEQAEGRNAPQAPSQPAQQPAGHQAGHRHHNRHRNPHRRPRPAARRSWSACSD